MEYDGTDFCGYQTQGQGERTVQSVLTQTLSRLLPREEVTLSAAGRTDTGVHALGQVVSFETNSDLPLERWAIALNSMLPRDLAVARAEEAPYGFHARFSARQRTYGYLIWTRRTRYGHLEPLQSALSPPAGRGCNATGRIVARGNA